jgi:Dolichyl-phosphate-mannose-protein mannosyltransferase
VSETLANKETALNGREFRSRLDTLLPLFVLVVGFGARLIQAKEHFLNPDEALHYLSASQPSVDIAYKAALTNAHPPLLILVLYYWRSFGQSELMLRMPSVLAGTACCWLAYLWLKEVTDRSTAFMGLLLFSFAPSLIGLSAEVRQYALLLFFMAGCLYLSERAIRENSRPLMVLFSLCLYGALLTHYSSLLFAFTMGIYMLLRLYPYGKRPGLFAVWVCGQAGALALVSYFLVTHVAHLKATGIPQEIAETWLRKSIFHPGDHNVAVFASAQTLRVFTYLFSHGLVGTLALLAFLAGMVSSMVSLLRRKTPWNKEGPTPRVLALLFSLPFVANCSAAIAGLYPYGGTRHNVFLAPFAVGGAAIGLATWIPARPWAKSLALVIALALCNFFPAPPPLIKARNHSVVLMKNAVDYLRHSAPPGSVLLADYQSGLLLGYYACGHGIVEVFPPLQSFAKADCGPYTVITAGTQEWRFNADDLPGQLANVAETYGLAPGTKVWLFDAGWITDLAPALSSENRCSAPRTFGENILICQLKVGGNTGSATDRLITK